MYLEQEHRGKTGKRSGRETKRGGPDRQTMSTFGNLQTVFHVLWALAMQLPVGVLKHVVSPDMHSHVFLPQALIQTLKLLPEISAREEGRGGKVISNNLVDETNLSQQQITLTSS